jgi:hypothetical protein
MATGDALQRSFISELCRIGRAVSLVKAPAGSRDRVDSWFRGHPRDDRFTMW